MNGRARRTTRRERDLPKLRGDGTLARHRDIPRQWQCHMNRQVTTIHRRLVRDLYAQLQRLATRRYCWAPLRWQIAMMEARDEKS